MEFLGETLSEILENKLGIVKSVTDQVIHHPFPDETLTTVKTFQSKSKAKFIETRPFQFFPDKSEILMDGRYITSPLWGNRGSENLALAITAFLAQGGSEDQISENLKTYRWPCRLEKVKWTRNQKPLYFSADHNEAGFQSLSAWLQENEPVIVLGVGKSKDLSAISSILEKFPNCRIILTETPFQTCPMNDYPIALRNQAVHEVKDPHLAVEKAFELAQPDQKIIITGSIYLVGHLLSKTNHWLNQALMPDELDETDSSFPH